MDDNESDNFFHKKVIEKAEITDHIEIAENGEEALDFLIAKRKWGQTVSTYSPSELIFLDINMPIMDGWQFLQEYNKLEDIQKGRMVVIMLTTSLNPTDVTRTEEILGISCFLYKPLTLEMINDIIKKYFPDYL